MRSIKAITKFAASLVLLVLTFGPFGMAQLTQAAPADLQGGAGLNEMGLVPGEQVVPGDLNSQQAEALNRQKQQYDRQPNECSGFSGCIATMVYWIGPGLASWVVSWASYFFNFSARIALSSTAYALDFLQSGWTQVLSLANMFFIFILIYAAFTIMLRAETARTMQTLAWVVAIALVVNFSFFFTRVVIDAGNILAVQFYNQIVIQNGGDTLKTGSGTAADPNAPADITKNIMASVGVHELLGAQSFDSVKKALGNNSSLSTLIVLTVLYIAVAIMFWILAISLLMVGVKFFLRVVGLWFILVFSPLAFVAQTLGSTRRFFDMWLRTLVSFSLYPAVFLFMFYILNLFVTDLAGGTTGGIVGSIFPTGAYSSGGAAASAAAPYTTLTAIANVSIRMMFVVAMLYIMLKVADWVLEQTGGMAATFVNRSGAAVLGFGFRTAANAGAFAGRNSVGRLAYRAADSETLKSKTGIIGNTLWRGSSRLSRSTFDVRNAPGASMFGARKGTNRTYSDLVDDRATQVLKRAEGLKASPTEIRNAQEAVAREKSTRIEDLNRQINEAKAQGNTAAASTAMAQLKTIQNEGKMRAKEAEKERITQFAQRIGGRNFRNLTMPSYGSVKGASAALDMLDGKKKKGGAQTSQAPSPAPQAPAAAAAAQPNQSSPAAAASRPNPGHADTLASERMLDELHKIRQTLDKSHQSTEEKLSHVAQTLHTIPEPINNLAHEVHKLGKKISPEDPGPGPNPSSPAAAAPTRADNDNNPLEADAIPKNAA